MSFRHIRVVPLSGRIGAEIDGVDLSKPLQSDVFEEIHRAYLDHAVIAFRGQTLSREEQIAFARRFGDLDVHPIAVGMPDHPEVIRVEKPAGERATFGTSWHSDNTFFEEPSQATVLYGVTIPAYRGDTLWASMESAYDALSPKMQEILGELSAIHGASRAYDPAVTGTDKYEGKTAIKYRYSDAVTREVQHPVIRTHPETGRRGIFVNPMFTLRIADLSEAEGEALLQFLFRHATQPEFTCRLRWETGTVVVWDNRCTQHYAIDDYAEHERLMYRVTVKGDRPVS